jgi:hypothetical protein
MDLSGLKWPLIIVVVVAIGWLGSSGGINWMISQSTDAVPGADATQDARDEQRLTSVAGYLLTLWRYEKAAEVMLLSIDRYGEAGKNYWYNYYRMAKCYEKMGRPGEAVNTLMEVMRQRPQITDDRVPGWDNLKLRATKIAETHQETLTDQVRQLNDM